MPVVEFRKECRDFAEGWIDVQRDEFKRLGVTGNWADPYLTMNYHAERVIAEEFQKFLMNGTLYQGSKPVMWSPVEKTALAEAEVEYHDHQSHTIWVKFRVKGIQGTDALSEELISLAGGEEGFDAQVEALKSDFAETSVVIWTTTPWTIPQNRAVCFGPSISYGLYRVTDAPEDNWAKAGDKLLMADALAESIFAQARVTSYERLRDASPAVLESLVCGHPLRRRSRGGGEWTTTTCPSCPAIM